MEYTVKIYPKVFRSNKRQKVQVTISGEAYDENLPVRIRIAPQEQYAIHHSEVCSIQEGKRYAMREMTKVGPFCYEIEHDFTAETRYSVVVEVEGVFKKLIHAYALDPDLFALRPWKGDTHLHSTASDGLEDPFAVACNYRQAGFDFIVLTDHHIMSSSVELRKKIQELTPAFTVIRGEEVHNHSMGYFHVVNIGGSFSVNDIIETDDDFVQGELARILRERTFDGGADPAYCAYRIFIAEQIRKGGGLAVLAHPYWPSGPDYNCQTSDLRYLFRNKDFDVLEVLAGSGKGNNGDNLQVAIWSEMCMEYGFIPLVGCSDSHTSVYGKDLFNKHFTIVFADSEEDLLPAIKEGRAVAVNRRDDEDFFAFGKFRYVAYARFLMDYYFPEYCAYTEKHAALLQDGDKDAMAAYEAEIRAFQRRVFAE